MKTRLMCSCSFGVLTDFDQENVASIYYGIVEEKNLKIAVISDSGTGWSEKQAKEKGIFYLPLQVKCGEEEFLDGVDITVEELYDRLRRGEMPTTSMPPLGRVEALFEELKEQEYEHVIAVPLSAGISSTASMIEAAAKRADLPITMIDPYTTVNAQGYLAECAVALAKQGLEPAEIERRLKNSAESANTLLVPDDLEHLKRGGRLTPLAAALGSMLKIKPILQLNISTQGKVDVLDKVRTMSKALSRMVEAAKEQGFDPATYELRLLDSEGGDNVDTLRRLLEETFPGCVIERSPVCPVIAAHTGLGVVAIQYQKKVEGIS